MRDRRPIRAIALLGEILALTAILLVLTEIIGRVFRSLRSRRVEDVPFSSLMATGPVGRDWASRHDIATDEVCGEIETFSQFDREGFDSDVIHPAVRRFYEQTIEYELYYETHWHRGFRIGAWLASFLTTRLEQLNLPGRSGSRRRLESQILGVDDPAATALDDSRIWTRTEPDTGRTVFVAIYSTYERDGVTYANVAVPLPWSNLSTVLRPVELEAEREKIDDAIGDTARAEAEPVPGVKFTTRDDGDGGLYLVTRFGTIRLPLAQTFTVRPATDGGPEEHATASSNLVGTHEMWVFGRQFLTIEYDIERRYT